MKIVHSYREVNKEFTEIVNHYLSTGYTINTTTMNTNGDEITKIYLVDNITHKLIRVALFGVSGEEFNQQEKLKQSYIMTIC